MTIEEFYAKALKQAADLPAPFLSPVLGMQDMWGRPAAPPVDPAAFNFYDPASAAAYVAATSQWVNIGKAY